MHATAVRPKNRRERRRKPTGLPWEGRCHCDECNGRPCPSIHMVAVEVLADPIGIRPRRVVARTEINLECFIDATAPKEPVARVGRLDDTESASAAGLIWLENQHYAGVNVDLRERELMPEGGVALEGEVERLESLRWYLYKSGVATYEEENRRIQRYYDICDMHRDKPRRAYQWLCAEFPGWLK